MSSRGSSSLKRKVGKYLLGRTIGEGTYAKVKYGQHCDSGEAVAVKVLDKEALVRSGMVEQIKREISILKQLRHPHVVNLLEVMSSRDKIYMVLELVTGGELFDRVVAEGPMKEHLARHMFSQLLDAVGYCHAHGIYHRDLKPENVLLSSNGSVKLSDFGLGTLPNPDGGGDGLLRTTCGTPNYVAPEVLAKRGYHGGPADIWSLGVVLYVVLAGCLPFDEDDLVALFGKISRAEYEVPPWLSPDAAALLKAMINPDPAARPTAEQLWSHPWMRSGLVRRSVAGWQALTPQQVPADIFAASVEPETIRSAYQSDTMRRISQLAASPGGSRRKVNAFELIKGGLDISALFEARDDVVARHTRFSSRAPLPTILDAIENAAVAVGGRATRQGEARLRLRIPNPKGTMHVLAEALEVLAGTHVVDLQKVKGNTLEFYKWYADLTDVLASIIARKTPGAAGDVGARAAATRRLQQRESSGDMRANAFELIAGCFNMGALFEEEDRTSRRVQFSSRRPPGEILNALAAAVAGLGGACTPQGERRAELRVPAPGGRSLRVHAHLIEVLAGVHVCQLEKQAGSSLDFMRAYGQLAGRLQHVMMKRNAHPTAQRAAALLAATPSMGPAQLAALEGLPPPSPSDGGLSRQTSASDRAEPGEPGAGPSAQRLAEAGGWPGGGAPQAPRSISRASLNSVPEEPEPAVRSPFARSSGGTAESRSAGSSPTGSSPPGSWHPLPPLVEGEVAGQQRRWQQPPQAPGGAAPAVTDR